MSTDARCSFTITEIRKDDPRLKEFDELPEDEKQSSIHIELQLLPGSEQLELEEVNLTSWQDGFRLAAADLNSLKAPGLQGTLALACFASSVAR